jgi:hypothetical protein
VNLLFRSYLQMNVHRTWERPDLHESRKVDGFLPFVMLSAIGSFRQKLTFSGADMNDRLWSVHVNRLLNR